ncbi:MAG TPA: hypothetical protein VMH30_07190 [Verrucomicrobiae bacterium]|nr:hypothetical protein [Verrucomicrobiae bacterium]
MKGIILIAILSGMFVLEIYSQQTDSDFGAKLIISANTNRWSPTSTLTVFFQITNCSTNISYAVDDIPTLNYSIYLRDNGRSYTPSLAGLGDFGNRFYHPSYWMIGPKKTYSWSLVMKIGTNVPPGDYELGATRSIAISAPNPTNQSNVKLVSNLLSIQVRQ